MDQQQLITLTITLFIRGQTHEIDLAAPEDEAKNCKLLLSVLNKPSISTTTEQQHDFISLIHQYQVIVINARANDDYIWMRDDLERPQKKWQKENKRLVCELTAYLGIVFNSEQRLLVEYLFHSKKDESKNLILLIITLCLRYNHMVELLDYWVTHIFVTLPFWTKDHFLFAVENNICGAFMCSFVRLKSENRSESISKQTVYNNLFNCYINKFNLSELYLKTLHKIALEYGKENKKMRRMQIDYYKNMQSSLTHFKRKANDCCNLGDSACRQYWTLKCGWIKCTKSKRSKHKLYICKGCKLVAYCSRSHQKKHWNCIHTLQCSIKQPHIGF